MKYIYEVYEYHTQENMEVNNLENRFNSLGLFETERNACGFFKDELEFQTFHDDGVEWRYREITAGESDLQEENFVCGVKLFIVGARDEYDDEEWEEVIKGNDYCYQLAIRKVEVK